MILQGAGVGYIVGGAIIVSEVRLTTGKLDFWRNFNKSSVVFDSIKTHSVGGTTKFILKLDNRRQRHVPGD